MDKRKIAEDIALSVKVGKPRRSGDKSLADRVAEDVMDGEGSGSSDEESDNEEEKSDFEYAAKDLMQALRDNDEKLFSEALRDAIESCSME